MSFSRNTPTDRKENCFKARWESLQVSGTPDLCWKIQETSFRLHSRRVSVEEAKGMEGDYALSGWQRGAHLVYGASDPHIHIGLLFAPSGTMWSRWLVSFGAEAKMGRGKFIGLNGLNYVKGRWMEGGIGFRSFRAFNSDTLMARTLKARCFPRQNVLHAKVGFMPSYTWRSIHGYFIEEAIGG